ncbi:MAG: hypothetical protein IV086_18445 [Hyphomonadaceae bacterium]|nr:hypothetical protein [Hyphomonadaceae bacterium]
MRALDAAPACYPKIEQRDRQTVVRALSTAEYLVLSSAISTAQQSGASGAPSESIVMQPNTYGTIALLLGSAAVEDHQYSEALALLDRGLALQSHHEMLLTEKVSAFQGLGRNAEALAVLDFILNDGELGLTADRSRIFRLKGVVLIDLQRLDEAEAALNDSIKLNPENPGARNELTYIAQLRANGPRRQLEITAPNAPRPK